MILGVLPAQSMVLTPYVFVVAAMLCLLAWRIRFAQIAGLGVAAAIAAGLLWLLSGLPAEGVLRWPYADWAPGARTGLRLDALSGPIALLIALIALGVGLLAWSPSADGRAAALRVAWAGAACGAVFSTDWLEISAWLTGMGLVFSALIVLQADRAAGAAVWAGRVFVWQALAGGAVMLGLGLVFANSGGLEPDRVGVMLDGARHDPMAFVGVALLSTGLAVFAGLAPLHEGGLGVRGGLAERDGVAGLGVDAAFMIMASTLVGFVCLLRIEGALRAVWAAGMGVFLLSLGAIGAVWAAGLMANAKSLRTMALLGWSSQLGVALVGIVSHETEGAVLHVLASTLAVSALLLGAHGLERHHGPSPISELHGFGRRAPIAGAAIVIALLSLTGAPFTIGFVSRFAVMESVIADGAILAAVALTLTALLGMWVAVRVIQTLFLNAPDGSVPADPARQGRFGEAWVRVPVTLLLALTCLFFGIAKPPAAVSAPAMILERADGR